MKDLNKIRMLSYRLVAGVQEKGINLSLLYIPDLSRYHIKRLARAGYGDEKSLRDASRGELDKLLPRQLVQRILESVKEENNHQAVAKAKWIVQDENCEPESAILPSPLKPTNTTSASHNLKLVSASSPSKTENPNSNLNPKNQKPKNVLEISLNRPDRIVFEGKEVKLTPLAFSLVYLLAQNPKEVLIYDYLIDTIWKGSRDATYTQITFHLSKIRRAVLETICHNKKNRKKVKDIFKVVSRRGIMLNLEEDKLKIS
jgi:helicase